MADRQVMSKTSSRLGRPKKPRTPISCDRCKARKTKCVDPVPGPCKYCARIGAPCDIPSRRKQRPFYHVTEEEYRCSMQILQHLLPTNDLSPATLKAIANTLENGGTIDRFCTSSSPRAEVYSCPIDNEDVVDPGIEKVEDLHDQMGCLMEDSHGEYRYVGAHAEIAFNAAVCSMKGASSPENIIEPSKFSFPPQNTTSPDSSQNRSIHGTPYLPRREQLNHYVSRFFREVHCIYWFYPVEQFHSRLDETYARPQDVNSHSWLCSLYSICALGSAAGESAEPLSNHAITTNSDLRTPQDFLALAKALIPDVNDEADIESVRALALLSIAMQTFGFRITSYLYMGTSIRIAFSLGLQHEKSHASQSQMTRQCNRRIWWTLYLLDQTIAARCGCPCAIDERCLVVEASLPSEQVLNPGTNTPLGILAVSVSLCRLRKQIIQTVYPEQSPESKTVSFSDITSFISSLHSWLSDVPSHLRWGVPVAPSHKRSVAILHLKYWDATMLLTQPFLLYLVLRKQKLNDVKRKWFQKVGQICLEAARNALKMLKTMENDHSLSSMVTFDATCILKVAMVMVLALVNTNMEDCRADIETCVALLEGMDQVGFCKTATKELPIRLKELGILKGEKATDFRPDSSALDLDIPSFDSFEQLQNINADFGNPFWMDMDLSMNISPVPVSSGHFSLDYFDI